MKKKKKSGRREIAEVVLALAIAWLFYQALILATGTPLPVVSVVSSSMHHSGPYSEWWSSSGGFYEERGIGKERFAEFPMSNGFAVGDLLFVVGNEPEVGDVVIYQRNSGDVVIVHRIIDAREDVYITKGDNNSRADDPVPRGAVFGKAVFAVPLLGYPRTLLHEIGI